MIESFYSYQTNENYSYDGTGNRTNTGYVTGDNNQTIDDGTYTYQYDDEGNRTRKTTKSTGAYVEYEWDHRNRLTRVEYRTSGGTLTKAVEYDYDYADRRVAKRVDDNADSTWDDVERFVYDGEDLTMVYDESGTPAFEGRYLHGPGIDTVLAYWQPGVPKIRWTFTDRLGSVRDVVEINGSTVTVVEHQNYGSFGKVTSDSNPSYDFRFGYTGRLWDADAGLQFNRARWYDPALGKFVSEDPIGFAAGDSNLSRYVGNDPVNFTDPSGLIPLFGPSLIGTFLTPLYLSPPTLGLGSATSSFALNAFLSPSFLGPVLHNPITQTVGSILAPGFTAAANVAYDVTASLAGMQAFQPLSTTFGALSAISPVVSAAGSVLASIPSSTTLNAAQTTFGAVSTAGNQIRTDTGRWHPSRDGSVAPGTPPPQPRRRLALSRYSRGPCPDNRVASQRASNPSTE